MVIGRQNVLDLIGANRQKYQSCLITCFSFDFTFFEERVMPVLRTANIRNVNVFLDGKYLDNNLEYSTGNEFRSHKTYGINPIYLKGVFHPKIMLLTGPKHGLLIIGSGNLTNSGLSTNDEIWGAFHMDSIGSISAPIFSAVWDYLQSFFMFAKGFNSRKIQWIYQYSPWIEKLPEQSQGKFIQMDDNLEICFIGNDSNSSIYKQVIQLLPKDGLKKITIVSPYFDEKGKIIEQLNSHFSSVGINCLVDTKFGLLPIFIEERLLATAKFWNWENCINDFNPLFNRLHAKLFHFEYVDGLEYLLLGSMNASIQAFGSDNIKAVNAEAGILIKRSSAKNYLDDLGINLPDVGALNIKAQVINTLNTIDHSSTHKQKIRILYSEVDNNRLRFWVETSEILHFKICILNCEGEELESIEIDSSKEENEVVVKFPDDVYKIFFTDSQNKRISNFCLIHRVFLQAKSNPDPIRESLDNIFAKGYEGIPELFAYVDFNWADEDDNIENIRGSGKSDKKEYGISKEYKTLSQEEFNKVNQLIIQKQEGLLNSSSVQIAEFLGVLGSGLTIDRKEEIRESFEQELLDDEDSALAGASQEVVNFKIIRTGGKNEQKAILRFFEKLNDSFHHRLKKLYDTSALTELSNSPISIKDLSNMLIGLYILNLYSNRTYQIRKEIFSLQFNKAYSDELREIEKKFKLVRIEKTDPENKLNIYYSVEEELLPILEKLIISENHFRFKLQNDLYNEPMEYQYLSDGEIGSDIKTIKGFLFNTLGCFLINCCTYIKSYEYDILNQKVEFFKKEIFIKALNIIISVHWKEHEKNILELLLLDLVSFLDTPDDRDKMAVYVKSKFLQIAEKEDSFSEESGSTLKYIIDFLIPKYLNWRSLYENDRNSIIVDLSSLNKGDIIFKKGLGFCNIVNNDYSILSLTKPGFPWDDIGKIFILRGLKTGGKAIKL